MPTTVNFSSLIGDMQVYLERGGSAETDPTVFNQLPRLVNAAERDCAQLLKLLGQIESLTSAPPAGGFQTGVAVVTKPDRWRQTVSINYGAGSGNLTRTWLYPRAYEYCTSYWPNRTLTDHANPPAWYADYDYQHWLISPTPDQPYPFEALLYMQPQLLDAENQTNFWTNYTPNLLLYSALLQAAPFLKDDPRIAVWQQMQQLELASLSGQDLQRILDRAAERKTP
jgi:hypothetical protein